MKRGLLIVAAAVVLMITGCGGGGSDGIVYDDGYGGDYTLDLQAYDDYYFTLQNQPLRVDFQDGVLANDFVCDCPDFDLDWPPTTASGGTLTGNDDGSFYYVPPPAFTGVDFFEYRIEDNYGSSTALVRIEVGQPPTSVAVVDNLNGNDNTGTVDGTSPFATIQQAVLAAGDNGTIVVNQGTGNPYIGTVNLLPGQTLVGQDFEDVLFQAEVRPTLTGPVNMAAGCTVRGLTLEGGRINALSVQGGEISQCDFINVSGYAMNLDNATGEWFIEDNIVETSGGGLSFNLGSNEARLLFQFNAVIDSTQSAVRLITSGSSSLDAGVFDNAFEFNQTGFTFDAQTSGTSTICLDLDRNENDDTYRLNRTSGTFRVEQLAILTELNSGTVTQPGSPVSEVANGFCGF